jgi:hypothetical protein
LFQEQPTVLVCIFEQQQQLDPEVPLFLMLNNNQILKDWANTYYGKKE